jgi:hypothetical protein
MPGRPLLIGAALVAAAGACYPRGYLDVRQSLRPPVARRCVASALATSPDVAAVLRGDRAGFLVSLRDSTAPGGRRQASVALGPGAGSSAETVVDLHLVWVGRRLPPAAEERAAMAVAGRVLGRLRAACAPDAPAALSCRYSGDRSVQSCPPAA